jgi:hypothetical protein
VPTNQITAYQRLCDRLKARPTGKGKGTRATAHCPKCNSSLSLTKIEGQALIYCHGGCEEEDILKAAGLTNRDLFDNPKGATYRYDDGRVVHRSPDKRFWQTKHPNRSRNRRSPRANPDRS